MRKSAIKKVLFTIAGLASLPAMANENQNDLRLMEELPVEQRVVVHKQVIDYLSQHPKLAPLVKVIAVDGKGTIYALDENMVPLSANGQPSCVVGIEL